MCVAVVASLAAGCGGGGRRTGPAPSADLQRYAARADRICARFVPAVLGARTQRRRLGRASELLNAGVGRLRGLEPPSPDARRIGLWARQLDDVSTNLTNALLAHRQHVPAAEKNALDTAVTDERRAGATARQLGMRTCARLAGA